jgi:phenylacetate-coenzyme A ligase PaaK-like adenylate-forming protein
MSNLPEAIYERLPSSAQHVAVSAYGYVRRRQRLGGRFRDYRRGFAEREHLTPAEWRAWQTGRLREMLRLAAETPFYREAFREAGLTAETLDRFELDDLERLPLLSKDQVRQDPTALCPGGDPGAGRPYSTSGSTGTPLTLYHSNDDVRRWYAMIDARYESFVGVTYHDPRATFSGRRIGARPNSRGPFHRYNLAERQLYFSPYHLGPATVATYVEALRKHQPVWMTGYAGAIHELARLALEQGLSCPPLKAVITSAEPVMPRAREDVAKAFGCRVTEEYGLIEGVCCAHQCHEASLHVSPDAGIVEILDESGAPCAPGVVGEIVATGLVHESQLLLRYRTGDLASWSDGGCACGRAMPILKGIEGRVQDAVVCPDGRRVTRLTSVARDLSGVAAMQFVQDRPDRVLARVVGDHVLDQDVRDEIERRLADRLGAGMGVDVEQVDALERTKRGKVRGVINTVGQGDEA